MSTTFPYPVTYPLFLRYFVKRLITKTDTEGMLDLR